MANDKTCIIGGGASGSREHTWPAALGGRRVNKGIYCTVHNNELGRHVAALMEQIDIVNAALGVRPDRHDDVKPARVNGPDGTAYLLARDQVTLAPPPDIDANFPMGQEVQQKFANSEDAKKWVKKQRENGVKFDKLQAGTLQTEFHTEPLHREMRLGRPPFMRGLLYLGLTYFAHHFPAQARQHGIDATKAEVQSDDESLQVPVSWQRPSVLGQLPPNPFEHGHTVAVSIDADGSARALVSLWGALTFGMTLGNVGAQEPARAITFINPMAEHPPNDVSEVKEAGLAVTLASDEDGKQYLREVITHAVPNPIQELLSSASVKNAYAAAAPLLEKFNAANQLSKHERSAELLAIFEGEKQRLLNLLKEGVDRFLQQNSDLPQPIAEMLRGTHAADPNGPRGVSAIAEGTLQVLASAFAADVEARLDAGTLSLDHVALLIAGDEGMVLAFKTVPGNLLSSLARHLPE